MELEQRLLSNFNTDIIDVEINDSNTDFDVPSTNIKSSQNINDELVTVEDVLKDYKRVRNIVLENITEAKEILQVISTELFQGESINPELISSYSQLLNTINSSIKLLSGSYKDIIATVTNHKKTNSDKKVVNNVTIVSTTDILEKLKQGLISEQTK